MNKAIQAMHRNADSMENIQLYMMQISELMRQLNEHIRTVGVVVDSLNVRITHLETSMSVSHVHKY